MAEVQQSVDSIVSKVDKLSKNGWTQSREVVPESGSRLPADISRGVARLTNFKVGETDDKEKTPYVRLIGIVEVPAEYQGEKFVKTVYINDNQYHTIQQQLDKVSVDVQNLRLETRGTSFKHVPALLKQAASVKRAFMFHTWQGEGNERVSTFTDPPSRKLDEFPDIVNGKASATVVEEQAPPPARTTRQFGNKAGSPPKSGGKAVAAPAPDPEPDNSDAFLDEVMEQVVTDETLPDFGDDSEALPDFDAAESQEPEAWVPSVDDVGFMKTKNGPLEVQLTKVDLKKKTFSAKSIASGKEAHNLSFDLLITDPA